MKSRRSWRLRRQGGVALTLALLVQATAVGPLPAAAATFSATDPPHNLNPGDKPHDCPGDGGVIWGHDQIGRTTYVIGPAARADCLVQFNKNVGSIIAVNTGVVTEFGAQWDKVSVKVTGGDMTLPDGRTMTVNRWVFRPEYFQCNNGLGGSVASQCGPLLPFALTSVLTWSSTDQRPEYIPSVTDGSPGAKTLGEPTLCASSDASATCTILVDRPAALQVGRPYWYRLTAYGLAFQEYRAVTVRQLLIDSGPGGNASGPTAVIQPTQSLTNPLSWTFDGSGSSAPAANSSIRAYQWDFGDHHGASGVKEVHTFPRQGIYDVKLTVSDTAGRTGSSTYQVRISPLTVQLNPGVSNGRVFSVDVVVHNTSSGPMTRVAFLDPGAALQDLSQGDAGSRGTITALGGPSPPLPDHLAAGQGAISSLTFAVAREGGVDLVSQVSGRDARGKTYVGADHAFIQIGKRALPPAELARLQTDALMEASLAGASLMTALQVRMGALMAWASGPQGGPVPPAWLTAPIADGTVVPPGTQLAAPVGWKVSMARQLGLDDRTMAWLPDDPLIGLKMYAAYSDQFAFKSGKVINDSGYAAYDGLKYAGEFYTALMWGDNHTREIAQEQLAGMVHDAGPTITYLGAILAYSHDQPLGTTDMDVYDRNPALKDFQAKSSAVIDALIQKTAADATRFALLAKNNPVAAVGQIGGLLGETFTTTARDLAIGEFGTASVARLGTVVDTTLATIKGGIRTDRSVAAVADPAVAAVEGALDANSQAVARQTLESLGEGSAITIEQAEQLGGYYAKDASAVQKIIKDIKTKFGVDIELQVRPGNPASLQYYRNGTGVPKPEWIKPKAVEWTDVVLGAPESSLGKATLYNPVRPSDATLATYTPTQQAEILGRLDTQAGLYKDSFNPNGAFQKLLADSKTAEGATYAVGLPITSNPTGLPGGKVLGNRKVTGLKYSLREVEGHPGAFEIIDDAAGGKFVLSDADYQAVVKSGSAKHISAAEQRGAIELEVNYRLARDTVSFGGHGWTHAGIDLPSKYSGAWMQFVLESSSPSAARRTIDWFIKNNLKLPAWLAKINTDTAVLLGRLPTAAELAAAVLEKYRPGQFVIKFNGVDMRVGTAAAIR